MKAKLKGSGMTAPVYLLVVFVTDLPEDDRNRLEAEVLNLMHSNRDIDFRIFDVENLRERLDGCKGS